jgi:hypothetical protein
MANLTKTKQLQHTRADSPELRNALNGIDTRIIIRTKMELLKTNLHSIHLFKFNLIIFSFTYQQD